MDDLRAYIVQEPNDRAGGIIYAMSDIEARRHGANEWNDGELYGMTCRRAPDLDDKINDRRAQTEALLARGWWFETESGLVTGDDQPFVSKAGEVYRNWMEWLGDREAVAKERRLKREAEAGLWQKWPFADAISVRVGFVSQTYYARISLPYMQDGVEYRSDEDKHSVTIRDLPVWRQAYATVNRDAEYV